METIPTIFDKAIPLPGGLQTKNKYFIPSPEYSEFWDNFYQHIHKHHTFQFPISEAGDAVNPFFGYFGYRFHPLRHIPRSFHIGLDITCPSGSLVHPVADGVLEYSGYGMVNGNYVLLSHPNIVTEDGFTLHTIYMHMRNTCVGFTRYQKMLREISLHSYPVIAMADDTILGLAGDTGNPKGKHTHLYMQCELRDPKGRSVAIDPARVLGMLHQENLTQDTDSFDGLQELYREHKDIIIQYGIEQYFFEE
ncbi:MAG: hypothetical protein ACI83D_000640 [Planctomycetota bacterium]|jgi:hypothetical protein